MKEVPKKIQPDVAGGYIAPENPDSQCVPYPWAPAEPQPIEPERSVPPCESPLP